MHVYQLLWQTAKLRKSLLKISKRISGHYGSKLWLVPLGGRKSSQVPKLGEKLGLKTEVNDDVIKLFLVYPLKFGYFGLYWQLHSRSKWPLFSNPLTNVLL